jgi:hypothetical protein
MFVFPAGALFLKWAQQQRENLISKLSAVTDVDQE